MNTIPNRAAICNVLVARAAELVREKGMVPMTAREVREMMRIQ